MNERDAIEQLEGSKMILINRDEQPFNIAICMAENALEKQIAKKPIKKHYEEPGEKSYIKYACPNGCNIQLSPVTERNFAFEHVYCNKCGQRLDWEQEDVNDTSKQ